MVIDIRHQECNIMKIIFSGENTSIIDERCLSSIYIYDEEGRSVTIPKKDIDNLIKALQKAKELWGN